MEPATTQDEFPAPTGVFVLAPRPAPLASKDTSNMHLVRQPGAWLIRYPSYHPRKGTYETFSDSVYGSEQKAQEVARLRRDQAFTEVGLPVHLRIRGARRDGRTQLAGVSLAMDRGDPTKWSSWRWLAHWVEDKQKRRSFSIRRLGFDKALLEAVVLREAMTGVLLDPDAVEAARLMQFGPPPEVGSAGAKQGSR